MSLKNLFVEKPTKKTDVESNKFPIKCKETNFDILCKNLAIDNGLQLQKIGGEIVRLATIGKYLLDNLQTEAIESETKETKYIETISLTIDETILLPIIETNYKLVETGK